MHGEEGASGRVVLGGPEKASHEGGSTDSSIVGERATVDGRTVLGTGLSPRHRYRLYFDSGSR